MVSLACAFHLVSPGPRLLSWYVLERKIVVMADTPSGDLNFFTPIFSLGHKHRLCTHLYTAPNTSCKRMKDLTPVTSPHYTQLCRRKLLLTWRTAARSQEGFLRERSAGKMSGGKIHASLVEGGIWMHVFVPSFENAAYRTAKMIPSTGSDMRPTLRMVAHSLWARWLTWWGQTSTDFDRFETRKYRELSV